MSTACGEVVGGDLSSATLPLAGAGFTGGVGAPAAAVGFAFTFWGGALRTAVVAADFFGAVLAAGFLSTDACFRFAAGVVLCLRAVMCDVESGYGFFADLGAQNGGVKGARAKARKSTETHTAAQKLSGPVLRGGLLHVGT